MLEAVVLFLLMLKHSVADLLFQAMRPMPNKSNYLDKGLWLHALDHGVLTFFVMLLFVDYKWALAMAVLDMLLHANIDWAKTTIAKAKNWKRDTTVFWKFQTLDQMLHYATYFLIVVVTYG